ncbi:MAG: hypothetical protein QW763_05565 [Archaeoglobaceae archaeon]
MKTSSENLLILIFSIVATFFIVSRVLRADIITQTALYLIALGLIPSLLLKYREHIVKLPNIAIFLVCIFGELIFIKWGVIVLFHDFIILIITAQSFIATFTTLILIRLNAVARHIYGAFYWLILSRSFMFFLVSAMAFFFLLHSGNQEVASRSELYSTIVGFLGNAMEYGILFLFCLLYNHFKTLLVFLPTPLIVALGFLFGWI